LKRLLSIFVLLALASPVFGQCILKQSTATQEISIGPFLDTTTGNTEQTGLTIANTDVRLKKGSADWASKNSGGATAEEHGNYRITLDATDTNTVGILEIYVHPATSLAVFRTCYVVTSAAYTAFYDSSAPGYVPNAPVNVAQFGGSNGTFSSGRPSVDVNSLASNSITAGVIADAAIDRATFAADTGLAPIRSNTAQAGASTTITLDASASATNSFYNNDLVLITGGTGAGQARFVTAYVGSTKVATVATWATNPDNTSTFAILPFDSVPGGTAPTAAQISTAVWQDIIATSDFTTAGSIGKRLADDVDAQISTRFPTSSAPTNFSSLGISAAGKINEVVTYTGNTPQTGDSYARLGAPAGASMSADVAAVNAKTTNLPSSPAAVGSAMALTSGERNSTADALLDRANAIESSVTLRQAARLFVSALGGKTTGSGTSTLTFRDTNDTKDVIVCTISSGNRTACTLNLN
jgi:hypothetical protein